MRRVLLFVLCAVFLSSGLYAQKIRLREIDKFSKKERVETSVETLYTTVFLGSKGHYMKVKAQRVDSVYTLHASIAIPEITKYTDGNGIMLLLDNEETIYLTSMYTGISSPMFVDGPITFDTSFSLTKADVEKAARILLDKGLRRVFISCGANGIYAATKEKHCWQSILPGQMVNTTGCGDASMAAIVWAYLEGTDLKNTALAAAAAGAIAMESSETINPAMSAEALKNRMKQLI
jgi:hypothetical protein